MIAKDDCVIRYSIKVCPRAAQLKANYLRESEVGVGRVVGCCAYKPRVDTHENAGKAITMQHKLLPAFRICVKEFDIERPTCKLSIGRPGLTHTAQCLLTRIRGQNGRGKRDWR